MRAVTLDVSVPRFLLARAFGRFTRAVTTGRLSGLRLQDVPEPDLPGPEWVKVRVLLGGICGTDLGNLAYSSSPAMEPFASFPAVLGHEILGVVEAVGANVTRVEAGDRVAIDPMIHCRARGYDSPCASCSAGRHNTCDRAGEDGPLHLSGKPLGPGLTIGYHRDLPGGWSDRMLAHQDSVFKVDTSVDDRVAALIEPLSISVHAVLNSPPPPEGPVLVIGSGPIAFATIWALRALGYAGPLIAQAKRKNEMELARSLGASGVVRPGPEARDALIETGAQAYMPIVGPEVYAGGGFPKIYDCVGNQGSLEQSLRYASSRGTVVVLGCAAEIKKLDLTFLWARELHVEGFVGYGLEEWEGRELHTFEVTHELLQRSQLPVDKMVTHVFPLREYRDALRTAMDRRTTGAVKVLLQP